MDKEKALVEIGLSDKEAKTYLAILELGSSTIKPISDRAGIKRTSIYNFIDHLVELGLVSKSTVRGRTHYQATSPTRLSDLQQERLKKLDQVLPEFMSVFNSLTTKPRINYFEGPEQVKNIMREELRCKEEVLAIWPTAETTEMIGGISFFREIDSERVVRGIHVKSLRVHDPKKHLFEHSSHAAKYLREVRFARQEYISMMRMGMALYDTGKVAFFGSTKEQFGILIESRELYDLMKLLFTLIWEKSTPAKPGEG